MARNAWRFGWKWWLALAITAGGMIYLLEKEHTPTVPESPRLAGDGDPELSARAACRKMIVRALNDPKSADFLPREEWVVEELPEHLWRVHAPLRAKNAFGATILTSFVCEVRDEGENWRIISVNEQK